ncbi:MAG: tRNA (N6-isopentenyl adenosine(37)-C2)-methylthiotransferase MiaB [Gammaproteobacteria bacterium]|nr:tRNA (N6-isopentenyl adenosine(37)-C2)-methylthiotransferase MiaB [Gammaproteobacteria bacterium]MBU1926778.1 tRNA (N6-isopentenyl adenosine(37)-C2)-methylthiotransferase MiaB [Gammaproteobacteria bacterium]MBU2545787.1 tRNA (N6-isopentenyl adenosine(37)-C2)-methylthiotransferase MiaB [Gammaproteobacteria bacterium]
MHKKLFIKTMGCQMNEYDSSRIKDLLKDELQVQIVETPEEADILLLNTCSIREKAQEKVFSDLGRWRQMKQSKPHLIIGVGGCVASQEGKNIIRRAPYVDIVFGPQTLHRLPSFIKAVEEQQQKAVDISFPAIEKFDNLPDPRVEGPTAYVSIMEGCNNFCSYCIVPYTRGREFSRPVLDVLKEIETLAKQGVHEITLLGQNVNNYRSATSDLADLIEQVAKIPDIDRIRFISSHPNAFSDRQINMYATIPALASHLHLPVQSGSDRILELMRRKYTTAEFKAKIQKLRLIRPNISIASDFIVGFPGETEDDFEQTMQLVQDVHFDHSFSFIYSPRPGTPAARLPDDVDLKTKKERLKKLQTLLDAYTLEINQQMVGKVEKVLVTHVSHKNPKKLVGRTDNHRTLYFVGDKKWIGQWVDVEITEALQNSLRGKV